MYISPPIPSIDIPSPTLNEISTFVVLAVMFAADANSTTPKRLLTSASFTAKNSFVSIRYAVIFAPVPATLFQLLLH